jgi:hypothetical protein
VDLVVNVLVIAGLALIVAGAWLFSQPAGLIMGGLALLVVAALVAAPVRRRA